MTASLSPTIAPNGSPAFRAEARLVAAREVRGYVCDPDDLPRRFVVELVVDGLPVALARADLHRPDLLEAGLGDGCYGFAFALPGSLVEAEIAAVRIANALTLVGDPIRLDGSTPAPSARLERGAAQWLGGLRLGGWVERPPGGAPAPAVRAFVDGDCVAETTAERWTHRDDRDRAAAVLGFDLYLPERLADGRMHRVHVVDGQGQALSGSPCALVAFEDGLAALLRRNASLESEIPAGELYDRWFPRSLPFDGFARWRARFPLDAPPARTKAAVAVALIGESGLDASLASLEAQRDCAWVATVLPDTGAGVEFPPNDLAAFLAGDGADCAVVAFARAGAILDPHALAHLATALDAAPQSPFAYPDVVLRAPDGVEAPIAHPAFDYERLLEQGYPAPFFAMRSRLVERALKAGVGDLFRLLTFVFDDALQSRSGKSPSLAASAPVHVPGFLVTAPSLDARASAGRLAQATRDHLAALAAPAKVEVARGALFPAARVRRAAGDAALSIVVATRAGADWLKRSGERWIAETKGRDCEILIVSGDERPAALAAGDAMVRQMRLEGPYRQAVYANAAATAASGEYLLFLADDDEPASDGWLDELLGRMRSPGVGAVGPVLLAPEGFVACAGYAPGAALSYVEAFEGCAADDSGYADALAVARQASALPINGLLTRRDVFRDLAGFDVAHFPRALADVDYCLRLAERGWRVLVAPAARLTSKAHLRARVEARRPAARDLAKLRLRWAPRLLADPAYNPLLNLDGQPFSGLAWPPREAAPRGPVLVSEVLT